MKFNLNLSCYSKQSHSIDSGFWEFCGDYGDTILIYPLTMAHPASAYFAVKKNVEKSRFKVISVPLTYTWNA